MRLFSEKSLQDGFYFTDNEYGSRSYAIAVYILLLLFVRVLLFFLMSELDDLIRQFLVYGF